MSIDSQILKLIKIKNPDNPLKYVHTLVQDYAIENLNNMILSCKDCSICNSKHTKFYGNSNATVMFINNYAENETDDIFDKESKYIIDKIFNKLNINTNELCYINAVNCYPHKIINNMNIERPPTKEEVDNCCIFLKHAIDIVKPKMIIILGNIGLNVFKKGSLKKERGKFFTVSDIPTIATYNPKYFIEMKDKKDEEILNIESWEFFNDLENAFKYLIEIFPNNNVILK